MQGSLCLPISQQGQSLFQSWIWAFFILVNATCDHMAKVDYNNSKGEVELIIDHLHEIDGRWMTASYRLQTERSPRHTTWEDAFRYVHKGKLPPDMSLRYFDCLAFGLFSLRSGCSRNRWRVTRFGLQWEGADPLRWDFTYSCSPCVDDSYANFKNIWVA